MRVDLTLNGHFYYRSHPRYDAAIFEGGILVVMNHPLSRSKKDKDITSLWA